MSGTVASSLPARRLAAARLALLLAALLAWAPTLRAAHPSVDAVLEPTEIALGESARLTVTMTGSGELSLNLPTVPGLEMRVVGHSRQIQIINGITLESTATVVRVTPEAAGTFKIPALSPDSAALVLRVNPSAASGGGSGAAPGSQGLLPPVPGTNGIRLTPDASAFMHVSIPKHEVYVGESIPVEIQVGMHDGFVNSINGIPKLSSNDFTLNNLSHQPDRGGRVIDGQPFTVLTWRSILAAVKPGKYSLTFETPLTVRIRMRARGDSMLEDLFGDPFMQNFFGATVARDITVTSPEWPITVLPLPTQGQPPGFTGAVGAFKVAADLSSTTNTAGDPLTLRMHVTGDGNFDRVESTMLPSADPWKTYDPKAAFKAQDPVGFHGEKTFEQPIVASRSGSLTVPPLAFSYFDPDTKRYETTRTAPLEVKVAPSAAESAASGTAPPSPAAGAEGQKPGLRPDHALAQARVRSLTPPYFQPRLVAIPSVLALLFAAGWVLMRRQERIAGDLQRAREAARVKRLEEFRARMAAAGAAGDSAAYLEAARALLQDALGARWAVAPAEVAASDVDARMADDPDRADIRRIFELADEASYSGGRIAARDFDRWSELVERQLGGRESAT
ncbi:MAG TPA: BatD family protein [Steroidobacteraceae bacterium]|jgi:hypothetical protein|nr:BatD family protein [Steroidobacteraceae bacterium]